MQSGQISAEEPYEWENSLIHSDLPLYDFEWDEFWPRGYSSPDVIAGCESRVAFGDWQFTPNPADEFAAGTNWYRFSHYGVFHCATNIRVAHELDELAGVDFSRGFFAKIGNAQKDGNRWELWVLQQGMIPGSEYTLMARPSGDDGLVTTFKVLQSRCPKSKLLEARNMDAWGTAYCKINSRRELLAFSRRMLAEPALGTLSRVETSEKGPETDASDPSQMQIED
ncbi:hypothetical protein K3148_02250 [Qipengyuania aurantiaca]|uniref:Uncharacterized protein n=1 Tax=Qipengyuania aurantiaca TaxID=2867233 RepID=A0ABX8ZML4_9SPHN|nr:hypothetical protein [Qipengyuania aurantiaca]QZD90248.1 hypothetical protein K3148_02250 [Qipengyuania aurantiaca]